MAECESVKEHVADLIRSIIPVAAVIVGWFLNALTNRYQYERRRKAEIEDRKARAEVERLEALYERIYDLRRQFERQIKLIDLRSQQNDNAQTISTDEVEEIRHLGDEIMNSFVFIRMKIRFYHLELWDDFTSLYNGLFRRRSYTEIKDSFLSQDPMAHWTEIAKTRNETTKSFDSLLESIESRVRFISE